MMNIYPCCVWRAPVIHAFNSPILPYHLCRWSSGHVVWACVVVVVADSRGHLPDP